METIVLILAVASTMMTTTGQETEGDVYRILLFKVSTGLYYEYLGTMKRYKVPGGLQAS